MRICKSAFLIKLQCSSVIPGAHVHNITCIRIMLTYGAYHISAIALPAKFFNGSNILKLTALILHVHYDTYRYGHTVIIQDKHITDIEIPLDHILLWLSHEQHLHIITFIFRNLLNRHFASLCFV